MRALIQRVKRASVKVDGQIVSEIGEGLLILLGVKEGDSEKDCQVLTEKIANLRVMADREGKMNLSVLDTKGKILVVSQFTLYADASGGRRPSFIQAAKPEIAKNLYQKFVGKLKEKGITVETGKFGEYMEVELVNDGPVTIMIESEKT